MKNETASDWDQRTFLQWNLRNQLVYVNEETGARCVVKRLAAPVLALSKKQLIECPNPLKYGRDLNTMSLYSMGQFVADFFTKAAYKSLVHCFVCDEMLRTSNFFEWQVMLLKGFKTTWVASHIGECSDTLSENFEGYLLY